MTWRAMSARPWHSADQYAAKKGAKGDVQVKNRKVEPYAYWPLAGGSF